MFTHYIPVKKQNMTLKFGIRWVSAVMGECSEDVLGELHLHQ